MTSQELTARQEGVPTAREETRTAGRVMAPAVDIFETEDRLTLIADMPGVEKEGLDIDLEKSVLTINGSVTAEKRGNYVFREFTASTECVHLNVQVLERIRAIKPRPDCICG